MILLKFDNTFRSPLLQSYNLKCNRAVKLKILFSCVFFYCLARTCMNKNIPIYKYYAHTSSVPSSHTHTCPIWKSWFGKAAACPLSTCSLSNKVIGSIEEACLRFASRRTNGRKVFLVPIQLSSRGDNG